MHFPRRFRRTHLHALCALALACAAQSLVAQSTEVVTLGEDASARSRVVLMNLGSSLVDVQLGNGVFNFRGLKPGEISALVSFPSGSPAPLYMRFQSDMIWRSYPGPGGGTAALVFPASRVWLVVFTTSQQVKIIGIDPPAPGKASIAFYNASSRELDEFAILDETLATRARLEHAPAGSVSGFVQVDAGKYGARTSILGNEFLSEGSEPDTLGVLNAEPGCWYLAALDDAIGPPHFIALGSGNSP